MASDFGTAYDNPWLESLCQVGQFASGVLIFGDIRDAASAIGEIIASGGKDGWGDLGLSVMGIGPRRRGQGDQGPRRNRLGLPRRRPRDGCPRSSITARTPVLMAGGRSKAIAEIEVGERVIATDPATGESGARAAERVIHSEGRKTLVRVRASGEVITATDRHPFWVESQGAWRDAAELRPGDVLREPGGERTAVESVRAMAPEPEHVHNLTVAGAAHLLRRVIRRTARNPGPAEQAHHVFPQRFVRQFDRAGINIHQPNLVVWWERGAHSRASRQYNDRWEDFFDRNQNPTDEAGLGLRPTPSEEIWARATVLRSTSTDSSASERAISLGPSARGASRASAIPSPFSWPWSPRSPSRTR